MTDQGRKVFNIIIALLVSIGSWFFVVYNYDPMTSEVYTDIPVTYTGLDTLANRGYAVADSNDNKVTVTLQQKRIDTTSISADDIIVTADVSGLSNGENTVAVTAEGPEGTQVMDVSVKTVTIEVESAASEDMEISVEYGGDVADNAELIVENMSVNAATVIASEERLANIDRVAAVIDPDDMGDRLRPMTVELVAIDKNGDKLLNVGIYPETVSFRAAAGFTKDVRLVVPVTDTSDDAYKRKYTFPETIKIKAREDTIDSYTGITAKEIDVTYYYEDSEIPIEIELPEGVYFADDQDPEALKLNLKVTEKKTEKESESEDSTSNEG